MGMVAETGSAAEMGSVASGSPCTQRALTGPSSACGLMSWQCFQSNRASVMVPSGDTTSAR
jgi:hypothetical protein